jgi:hypothetical protein
VERLGFDPPFALTVEFPDVAHKLYYAHRCMRRRAREFDQFFQVRLECAHSAALSYFEKDHRALLSALEYTAEFAPDSCCNMAISPVTTAV